eukprot:2365150-Alexandrium_andersonii.AAC.1
MSPTSPGKPRNPRVPRFPEARMKRTAMGLRSPGKPRGASGHLEAPRGASGRSTHLEDAKLCCKRSELELPRSSLRSGPQGSRGRRSA